MASVVGTDWCWAGGVGHGDAGCHAVAESDSVGLRCLGTGWDRGGWWGRHAAVDCLGHGHGALGRDDWAVADSAS